MRSVCSCIVGFLCFLSEQVHAMQPLSDHMIGKMWMMNRWLRQPVVVQIHRQELILWYCVRCKTTSAVTCQLLYCLSTFVMEATATHF